MLSSTPTWDCGTARSMNNAFSVLYEPRAIPDSARAPKKRGPKSKQQRIAEILRVNPEVSACASFIPKSITSPR